MSNKLKIQLVIIDPQNDFIGDDKGNPIRSGKGNLMSTLPVMGAEADMKRLARFIEKNRHKFDDIHVTLDSHNPIDVAHPPMWVDASGKNPNPFTLITSQDIDSGVWLPREPAFRPRLLSYTKELEAKGKYKLLIWPEHCEIGTWGHNVYEDTMGALLEWMRKEHAKVDFVTKGSNPFTEHYGALMAEVPDPADPSTQLNTSFLTDLQDADIIAVGGEASSHCVLETLRQITDNIGDEHLKKIHILTDCMSPVGATPQVDFPTIATTFMRDMEKRGVHLTTSDTFLS